jgi:hypothetical protein
MLEYGTSNCCRLPGYYSCLKKLLGICGYFNVSRLICFCLFPVLYICLQSIENMANWVVFGKPQMKVVLALEGPGFYQETFELFQERNVHMFFVREERALWTHI